MEKKRESQLLLDAELSEIKTTHVNQKITRHQLMVFGVLRLSKYLNIYCTFFILERT